MRRLGTNRNFFLPCILMLAVAVALLYGYDQIAMAADHHEERNEGGIERGEHERGGHEKSGIEHQGEFFDARHGHNRPYPIRGGHVRVLPPEHREFVHHGVHFFFSGGIWYRPAGPDFIVVAPPIGLVIPFLPPYYATIWIGGRPYYYANEVYYAPAPDGFMIVEPPEGALNQPPPSTVPPVIPDQAGNKIFIYPRQGQSPEQQAKDQYECHRWAVNQTGYDPTNPPGGAAHSKNRADYQRAMEACLNGRGYTVK